MTADEQPPVPDRTSASRAAREGTPPAGRAVAVPAQVGNWGGDGHILRSYVVKNRQNVASEVHAIGCLDEQPQRAEFPWCRSQGPDGLDAKLPDVPRATSARHDMGRVVSTVARSGVIS